MAKRGKVKKTVPAAGNSSRFLLILEIALVYILLVLLLVSLSIVFKIPLYYPAGEQRPTGWLNVIRFVYYGVPFLFSISFGWLFRPFWPNFLRLGIFIFALQFSYSLVVFGFRAEYLERLEDEFSRSRLVNLRVEKFSHYFQDDNKDGAMDRAIFEGAFTIDDLPPGKYAVTAIVTQNGKDLHQNPVARIEGLLRPGAKNFRTNFEVGLKDYQPHFRSGPLDLEMSVEKVWKSGARGEKIRQFTRWSPFLRFTSWDGEDEDFKDRVEDLGVRVRADRFYLLPL